NERAPDDYPTILHASLSVPDFVANKAAEPRAIEVINQACATLPLESARAIGMACNTAHMLLDQLAIPRHNFVSMIESVTQNIKDLGVKKVGLLASHNTIHSGLYKNALADVDIDTISPSAGDIAALNTLIHEVIAGRDVRQLRPILTEIANKLERE